MGHGLKALVSTVLLATPLATNATLVDRGGGMIYDTVLNVTWLQDANYANSRMTWQGATQWAESLSFGGFTDWRLPSVSPRNGSSFDYGTNSSEPSGLTDLGFNVSGTYSELGYMFYINLGNLGYYSTTGEIQPGWANINSGPFTNIRTYFYWTGTPYDYSPVNLPWNPTFCAPPRQCAWDFVVGYGDQTIYSTDSTFYAWAVRDGDVSTVPEPATVWLLLSGLVGIGVMGRGTNRTHNYKGKGVP